MTKKREAELARGRPARVEIDKRVERTKEVVLDTTFKLMTKTGMGGVSIDEVARTSGVAKTTIYRHWPSRSSLLMDACSRLRPKPDVPDTGGLEGDIKALATRLAGQLQSARWPAILPSIIDAAERDAQIAQFYARLQAGFTEPYRVVLERAQGRGELSSKLDVTTLIACIVGPLFYRRWYSRETIDQKFVNGVLARALDRRPASPASAGKGRTHRKT
jgi:AcrR family transcriptional regulator